MGVTRSDSEEGTARESRADAPTLLSGSVGDRCANCGAPLASDQRYCVQCGERRGASRFSAASMGAPPDGTEVKAAESSPEHRRWSSGATLIAGIATLLLAMGVGVLIGKAGNNNGTSKQAAAPQVITVGGGGTAAGATGAASTGAAGASGAANHAHVHAAPPPPKTEAAKAVKAAAAPKPTHAAAKKASHAAASVLGGSGGQQNNTVSTGQSCASGSAGCQGGKFTGNFFGGGG